MILDLYAGIGGAARGYAQPCVGVDLFARSDYPGRLYIGDVFDALAELDSLGGPFDLIHASPPPRDPQIPVLRELLRGIERGTGTPWVIMNTSDAGLEWPVTACGYALGRHFSRHREVQASFPLTQLPHVPHPNLSRRSRRQGMEVVRGVARWPISRQLADLDLGMIEPGTVTQGQVSQATPPVFAAWVWSTLQSRLSVSRETLNEELTTPPPKV